MAGKVSKQNQEVTSKAMDETKNLSINSKYTMNNI